jgi:UDP-N-acetyl-D-glucosamine dehydrogenase
MAYKKDVGDVRESPVLDILEQLLRRGATVSYSDPYVTSIKHGGQTFEHVEPADAIRRGTDCFVICTDHSVFDWKPIVDSGVPIVDTRNALRNFRSPTIVSLSGRTMGAPPVAK